MAGFRVQSAHHYTMEPPREPPGLHRQRTVSASLASIRPTQKLRAVLLAVGSAHPPQSGPLCPPLWVGDSLRIFLLSLWPCTPSASTTPGLQVETPDSRGGGGWALCTSNSRGWVVHPGQESCMGSAGPWGWEVAVAERASQVPREDRAGRPRLSESGHEASI